MKKITTFISILTLSAVASTTFSAGFSFVPASGSYTAGQTYTVSILVNPQGDTVYTAKAEINFPSDLLQVQTFSYGSSWIPLPQPGYDLVDNVNGKIIKTGGYPGGLKTSHTFGTITFLAKKSGNAALIVANGSQLLDGTNNNSLSGSPSATFSILEKSPKSAAPTQIPEQGDQTADSDSQFEAGSVTGTERAKIEVAQAENLGLLASVFGALSNFAGTALFWLILLLLIIIAYAIWRSSKKK